MRVARPISVSLRSGKARRKAVLSLLREMP
jgi:hypothetical protein